MSIDYSRPAFLKFLDYMGEKGLINKATAAARKSAANKILSVLQDDEVNDISKIDIEDVSTRFFNLHKTDFTPESLSTYKSRLKSGIEDFIRYSSNPAGFRAEGSRAKPILSKNSSSSHGHAGNQEDKSEAIRQRNGDELSFPIPIRSETVIRIFGLPSDLTEREAQKICRIVAAMAVPSEPDTR